MFFFFYFAEKENGSKVDGEEGSSKHKDAKVRNVWTPSLFVLACAFAESTCLSSVNGALLVYMRLFDK